MKLVKAPYLLERRDGLRRLRMGWRLRRTLFEKEFDQRIFDWDGRLEGRGTFVSGGTLRSMMGIVLGMEETGLSDELKELALPYGDWVVRADAPPEQKLRALEEILYELFEQRFALTQD